MFYLFWVFLKLSYLFLVAVNILRYIPIKMLFPGDQRIYNSHSQNMFFGIIEYFHANEVLTVLNEANRIFIILSIFLLF